MTYIIPPTPVLQIVAHIQLNATENTCRILQDLKIVLLVHKVFTLFLYSLPQSLLYWQSYYLVYVILVEFDIVTGVYCIFIMASYILKFMVGSIRTSVIYSITMILLFQWISENVQSFMFFSYAFQGLITKFSIVELLKRCIFNTYRLLVIYQTHPKLETATMGIFSLLVTET